MSDQRLAALLSELLSDEDDDVSFTGDKIADFCEATSFDPSADTSLFNSQELQAAVSGLTEESTELQCVTERQPVTEMEAGNISHEEHSSSTTDPSTSKKQAATPNALSSGLTQNSKGDIAEMPNSTDYSVACYPDLLTAELSVRSLVSADIQANQSSVLERLKDVLVHAQRDWNPEGRPDASGGMIGGAIALRGSSATDPLSKALQNQARYGTALVISEHALRNSSQAIAVGTSRGLVIIQIHTLTSQGIPSCELFELTDTRSSNNITALAFSQHTEKEKWLLAAGHEDGVVNVWDISGRKCIVSITGHVGAILNLAFLGGRSPCVLLSSAANGGMFYHSLTSWVVRTTVSSKLLSEGIGQPLIFNLLPTRRLTSIVEETGVNMAEAAVAFFGDGMISLCHLNMCNIGRLFADGRLAVFYQIPKPVHVHGEVTPTAIWAPLNTNVAYARHTNPDIDGRVPCGVLAVAWDMHLSLLKIPLLGDPQPDNQNQRQLSRLMDVSDWGRLAHELHISNIASWESDKDGAIQNVTWLSSDRLTVIRRRGILTQLLLFDTKLRILDQVEIDDSLMKLVIRNEPSELFTYHNSVTSTGSRITILGSMALKWCHQLEWKESVSILMSIEKWMMAMHLLVALSCQKNEQTYITDLGLAQMGTRETTAIQQNIAAVIVQFLEWRLSPEHCEDSESLPIPTIAQLVVDLCVFSQQTELLFHEVFPRFLAANAKDSFLEKLERSLTTHELRARVPPEVMQSLVEYCCEIGKPEKVERCVLQMDISSLDLNQVIPLCIQHHLFTALLSIFNNSLLRDCVTPAKYLVNAIYAAEDQEQRMECGTKLLFYLRCCLFGESYPPGRERIDAERALTTKQQILGFLLFTSSDDLDKVWDRTKTTYEEEGGMHSVPGSYPVFRCVLSTHPALILKMLKDALQDWECMEKDLLEAFKDGPVEEMPSVRSVTQVIVDALIDLLEEFVDSRDVCLDYMCYCVAIGRAVVHPSTALLFLEHLSQHSQRDVKGEYQETEQELQFCGIVRSVGIELNPSKRSTMTLTKMEGEKVLGLALNAHMLTAAALLYHLFGDYHSALEYHIQAGNASSTACFGLKNSANSKASAAVVRTPCHLWKVGAVLCCMGDLAKLNPDSAASMVMRHFPNDQEAVIQGLQGTRDLLYKYLKSSMDTALNQTHISLSSDANQLLTKPHCTLYVSLMAEYEPEFVLNFLKTYDHMVDVQQCQKDCLEFGLKDAAAHLMEREGDVFGALDVLVEKIHESNVAMERAILMRSLDSLETSLARQLSLSAILRVSTKPDSRIAELPKEVSVAQSALSGAVMLCRRNSLERDKQDQRRQETLRLWFVLLQKYIDACKNLSIQKQSLKKSSHVPSGFYQKGIIKNNDQFEEYPRLAFLRDIYAALIDEVITAMADYVPLMDVTDLIITEHGGGRFGDFRSTLLSLINSYKYEQSILTSIARLMSSDAYRVLVACHKKHARALPRSNASTVL